MPESLFAPLLGGSAGLAFVVLVWSLSERSARRHEARRRELMRRKLQRRRRERAVETSAAERR